MTDWFIVTLINNDDHHHHHIAKVSSTSDSGVSDLPSKTLKHIIVTIRFCEEIVGWQTILYLSSVSLHETTQE
jgi:hypothetical protein